MMDKNNKKERERFYLEKFLDSIGWNASVVRDGKDDGKEPDFILSLDGMDIGVEMTQLSKDCKRYSGKENVMALKKGFYGNHLIEPGEYFQLQDEKHFSEKWMKRATPPNSTKVVSNKMANEGRHNKFLRLLAKEYYMSGGCSIMLKILFGNPNEFEIKSRVGRISSLLKEKTASFSTNDIVEFELDDEIKVWIERLPDKAEFKEYKRWQIVNDFSGWSRQIDNKILEDLLLPKYEKVENYRKTVEHVIALLYADRSKNSGLFHIEVLPPKVKFGGFNALYLYLHGGYPTSSYWSIGHSG